MSWVTLAILVILVVVIGSFIIKTISGAFRLLVCGLTFGYIFHHLFIYIKMIYGGFESIPAAIIAVIGFCVGWGISEGIDKMPLAPVRGLLTVAIGLIGVALYLWFEYPQFAQQVISYF